MDTLIQFYSDFFVLIGWIGSVLGQIVNTFLSPLNFIFTYLKAFISNAFSAPVSNITYTWNAQVLAVFNAIPYFSALKTAIFVAIGVLFIFFIFREITKI